MLTIAIAVVAFLLSAASNFLETRYVQAVARAESSRDRLEVARAARAASVCDLVMWCIGAVGLYAAVEIGWWVLIPEGLGLFTGTRLAFMRSW